MDLTKHLMSCPNILIYMKRIKETRLGGWLKENAPYVFEKVAHALPSKGVLGIVKNLVSEQDKNLEFKNLLIDMEMAAQEQVTRRWEADAKGDNQLAKTIRPLTLIVLLVMFIGLAVADSASVDFNVKDSYIDLLQILSLTAFGAYFAGRSIEKSKK